METDGDILSALPGWLRAVLTLLLQQGAAVAIAIFLVWWMSTRVIVNQEEILTEIRNHRQESALAGRMMSDFANSQEDTQRTLVMLQLQTCLNTAQDNSQRRDCAKAAR